MKITIRPVVDPGRELDVTHRLVAAVAEALWMEFGGNQVLNWMEAETQLEKIVRQGVVLDRGEVNPHSCQLTRRSADQRKRSSRPKGAVQGRRSGQSQTAASRMRNSITRKEARRPVARKQA